VGWVSILQNDGLRELLGIPSPVIPVAYLCIGYPDEFAARPMLEATGWRDRLPLAQVVHYNHWQGHAERAWSVLDRPLHASPAEP